MYLNAFQEISQASAAWINSNMRCIWIECFVDWVRQRKGLIVTWDVFEYAAVTENYKTIAINSNMRCIWMILSYPMEHVPPLINSNMRCIWIPPFPEIVTTVVRLIVTWDVFESRYNINISAITIWLIVTWDVFE